MGGVFLGFLSVRNLGTNKNIIHKSINLCEWALRFSQKSRANKLKVVQKNSRIKTDEEFNLEQKLVQEEIDKILDKISRSGYDSLNKYEKDLLFKQSRK